LFCFLQALHLLLDSLVLLQQLLLCLSNQLKLKIQLPLFITAQRLAVTKLLLHFSTLTASRVK
jgi:hypothetical protein